MTRKTMIRIATFFSIAGFLFSLLFLMPGVQAALVAFIEKDALHRKLRDPQKWMDYLCALGLSGSVFFAAWWYCLCAGIRRIFLGGGVGGSRSAFTASSCILAAALLVYLVSYFILTRSYGSHDRLRFPLFILLFIFVLHIYRFRVSFCQIADSLRTAAGWWERNAVIQSKAFVFCAAAAGGALFFVYLFGTAILDCTYTDWLLRGGDLSQHYLGWRLYRNSAWHFPAGLMDNIVFPFKESIVYSDSIPLFALIFKLLSPVLPRHFQYFGLFGILCYMLQGGFASLIIKKLGGGTARALLGSALCILSTVMFWRMYAHTALAAHFIILCCILACLCAPCYNGKKQAALWSALLSLTAFIHLYYAPMALIFLFFFLLREWQRSGNLKKQLAIAAAASASLVLTMFFLGTFYSGASAATGGLGYPSLNLNAFLNPQGMSRFIKDMPLATGGQYEGNAYLGLGVLVMGFAIALYQLYTGNTARRIKTIMNRQSLFPYGVGIVLSFLIFALSPTVTLNQYKLFTYPVPYPIGHLWSIFRSTGRMAWPILYIIIFVCVWQIIKKSSALKAAALLALIALIQWTDLSPYFTRRGGSFKTRVLWRSELTDGAWARLAEEYAHIFYVGTDVNSYDFLNLAADYNLTVNDAYLARKNEDLIEENKQKEFAALTNGEIRDNTIYVFADEAQAASLKKSGLSFYKLNGVLFGLSSQKPYLPIHFLFGSELQ